MILHCTCKHMVQDRLHGKGQRVHTPVRKKSTNDQQRWRCTVCVRERTESDR